MPNFIYQNILSLILFSPVVVILVLLLIPGSMHSSIRWTALLGSLVPLAFTIVLWSAYDPAQTGFQFEQRAEWYSAGHSSFHGGVDGISMPMLLLTALLVPLGFWRPTKLRSV